MQDNVNSYLNEVKQKIDTQIEDLLQNKNPLIDALYKSAAYSASGGKRIRAVFTYLVGDLFNVKEELLWLPACSIELIHAASLIMDDLPYMEDSQLRRGKPANHVVFGQDVALLASVGLISEASKLVNQSINLKDAQRLAVANILSKSYGFDGLVAGQFVDLKLKRKDIDFSIIEFINLKKTTALFSAAVQIAAELGNASPQQKDAMDHFAENVGFAFQIAEELRDATQKKSKPAKIIHQDQLNLVGLFGDDEAKKYLQTYYENALNALDIFGEKANKIKAFIAYLVNI